MATVVPSSENPEEAQQRAVGSKTQEAAPLHGAGTVEGNGQQNARASWAHNTIAYGTRCVFTRARSVSRLCERSLTHTSILHTNSNRHATGFLADVEEADNVAKRIFQRKVASLGLS